MTRKAIFSAVLFFLHSAANAAAGDWKVMGDFSDADLGKYQSGQVVVVPIEASLKEPGLAKKLSNYSWKYSRPENGYEPRDAFNWGASAIRGKGQGAWWWWHERLAFDFSTHEVRLLPRRGLGNVKTDGANVDSFWCKAGLEGADPVVADAWATTNGPKREYICPTSLVHSLGTKRGVPLIGREELYQVDTAYLSSLIESLQLDQRAEQIRDGLLRAAQRKQEQESRDRLAREEDEASLLQSDRDAFQRGQAVIARHQIGERLCMSGSISGRKATISAFLEDVKGAKARLRVNAIGSDSSTWTGTVVGDDGVAYSPGAVIWSATNLWSACR